MKRTFIVLGVLAAIALAAFLYLPTPSSTLPVIQEAFETPPPPDLTDEERQRMAKEASEYFEKIEPGGTTIVAGPETAGSQVLIAGKDIQLPPDVFVAAYVSSVTCISEVSTCPQPPVIALSYFDDDEIRNNNDTIGVELRTGKIVENSNPEEKEDWQRVKERFSWLTEQLGDNK